MHEHGNWVVDIDSLEVRVTSAPEEEICACVNGDCGCPDECVCTEDECQCELYSGPDDDFAYEEMDHFLRQAMEIPLTWKFDGEDRKWRIVNTRTDEPVWEPPCN